MEIELAAAVQSVRDELLAAARVGADQDIEFQVGPIEMEFEVDFRADARAKAGFKAWVVNAEAEGGVERGKTHRVGFSLTPRRRGGGDLSIAADRPEETADGDGRGARAPMGR